MRIKVIPANRLFSNIGIDYCSYSCLSFTLLLSPSGKIGFILQHAKPIHSSPNENLS